MIPILDLTTQYANLKSEIDAALAGVCASGAFINGPSVKSLENEIAQYVGARHGVGLNSGTDALHLALRALDIGAGDEVITTPFTFVATTEAIGIVGAKPVFVDIDPRTYNIDPDAVEAAITARTKAIMPIHLYGAPADMSALMAIARRRGLRVIEDCAQAIGATLEGRFVGTFGDIGAYSFFPSKNLGAYGDGGMAVCDSDAIAGRLRSLRAHGGRKKYHHEELGVNSRLDEMQAAILRVKLPHLDAWTRARNAVAARYTQALQDLPAVTLPVIPAGGRHVFHQYTIRVAGRDGVQARLQERGVQTMVYYPVPLHLQEVHRGHAHQAGDFPHSERAASEVLSLPMFPELTEEAQARVIEAVRECVSGGVLA